MSVEKKTKKILMVASFSPPTTGQSIASDAVFLLLQNKAKVERVNLSKPTFKAGLDSLSRVLKVLMIFRDIYLKSRDVDVVYYTISQSLAGGLKDVLIFLLLYNRLHKFVLHSHGFGIKREFLDRFVVIKRIYKHLISKMKKVIVLGPSHQEYLKEILTDEKTEIVYNFSDDGLFIPEDYILKKFELAAHEKYNFLFLSNLLPGKGHNELVNAFDKIFPNETDDAQLTFAGGFRSKIEEEEFIKLISGKNNIKYRGIVNYQGKSQLYREAHFFCLPTYYAFEGQPIAIIEAMASGCVIITTDHAGITDIVEDANGSFVIPKSVDNLASTIENMIQDFSKMSGIGLLNRKKASKHFSQRAFEARICEILLG